ncbi:MAG: hypothetical protein ACLT9S_00095 [Faecalibacterium sp.]
MMFRYDGGTDPGYSRGWCFDFATEKQVSVTEMLQRMGLDGRRAAADALRAGPCRPLTGTWRRAATTRSLRSGGLITAKTCGRMKTALETTSLDDLCLLLPEQNRLVLRGGCWRLTAGSGWRQLDVEIRCRLLTRSRRRVLTDTYGSASVQLEETQGHHHPAPPHAGDRRVGHGLRHPGWNRTRNSYPILGIYNEYIDLCIGELGASFLTRWSISLAKDGVVEYVDVPHCLMFGQRALVCQGPIYIANQGVALERAAAAR